MTNFGHMTTTTNFLNFLVTSYTEITKSFPLFKNGFILRRLRVGNIAGIIKITIRLIIITNQESIRIKRIKMQFLNVFPDLIKIASSC